MSFDEELFLYLTFNEMALAYLMAIRWTAVKSLSNEIIFTAAEPYICPQAETSYRGF